MSNLSLSLNIDTRTSGSESLKKLAGLIDELGTEAQQTHPEARMLGERINELEQQQGAIASFRLLKKELGETTARLEQAKAKATALGREMGEAEKPTKALSTAFNNAKTQAQKLEIAEQQQTLALQSLRGELSQSGIKTNQLNSAQKQLATQFRACDQWAEMLSGELELQKRALDKTATSTEKLTTKNKQTQTGFVDASNAGKGFNGQLNKITTGLVAAGAAYIGINTVTSSIKDLLATGGKFEKLDAQMRGIMGSIAEGDKATAWVKDFAKNTPLQLDGVTKAFIKAKAYGLDPMDGTLQTLTDSVSKLGGGQEELEGVVLAVGQAWSKQKLQAEEVNQLVERGIPVWALLEKALGKSTAELQKMSEQGKIGRTEIKLLMDEMGKSSQGSAKAMMSTWDGIVSNLMDNFDKVKNTIAKAGLLDTFKAELSGISTAIDEMAADGSLQEYAKEISDAIVGTLTAMKNGLVTVYEWRSELATLAKVVLGIKLASMFGGFVGSAYSATTALLAHRAAISATAASATLLGNASKVMFGPVGVAIAAAATIYGVGSAYKDMKAAQEAAAESTEVQKEQTRLLAETFDKYSKQVGFAITSTDQWEQLLKDGDVRWNETAKSYEKVNKALEKKIALEIHNSQVMAESLLPITDQLNTKYRELVQSGSSASDAIAEIAKSIDATSPTAINEVVEVLSHLKTTAQITSSDIEAGLRTQLQNLSHDDLALLSSTSTDTFNSLGIDLQSIITAVDPLNKEFEKLGLKFTEVSNASTETANIAITAFDNIAKSAGTSSTVIQTAFNAALNKAQTQADLEQLKTSWEDYAKKAKLSGDDLAAGLLAIKVQSQDLSGAYAILGITSTEKLQQTAAAHRAAYEQVKLHSSNVNDHKLAVLAWAESEIEAAKAQGKTISNAVLQEAAIYGVTKQISDQIKALTDQDKEVVVNRDKWINRASEMAKASGSIVDAALAEMDATDKLAESKERLSLADERNNHTARETTETIGLISNGFMAVADQADLTTLSIGGLSDKVEELEWRIATNRQVHSEWWSDMARAQIVLDQQSLAIANQTKKLRELEQGFANTANPTLAMISNTENALNSLNRLDDAQLSSLNAQLDSAKAKLEALQNSAESALASVQNELDRELGNLTDIENRSYKSKLTTLDAQLAEAKTYQNSAAIKDLQETIRLTEKLHKINLNDIEADKKATQAKSTSTNTATTATPTTQTVTVKLELGGSSATIPTTEAGKNDLLALLTKNKLVTG